MRLLEKGAAKKEKPLNRTKPKTKNKQGKSASE